MRILVLSPKENVKYVKHVLSDHYSDLEIDSFGYDHYYEIIDRIKDVQGKYDGILFPGYVSYMYTETRLTKECPWEYIHLNEGALYKTLMEVSLENEEGRICDISFDTFKPELVRAVFKEMGMPAADLHHVFAKEQWEADSYDRYLIGFHKSNYYAGMAKCCVTGITEVWKSLRESGIPCVRIKLTEQRVLEAYHKLYTKQLEIKKTHNEIMVMLIRAGAPRYHMSSTHDDYEQIGFFYRIHRQADLFAKRVSGGLFELTSKTFAIVAKSDKVKLETNDFDATYLSDLFYLNDPNYMTVGIGLAETPDLAKYNAYIGLEKAEASKNSVVYIVYDRNNIRGPIRIMEKSKLVNADSTESVLKSLGISGNIARKLAEVIGGRQVEAFSSGELAKRCKISKRNMDRVLRLLEDVGICKVIGYQKNERGGRPTRIFEFVLNDRGSL